MTVAAAILLSATVFAEEKEQKERSLGHVSGSFETNTNAYLEDAKTMATVPPQVTSAQIIILNLTM